ncbi:efflux transporter outer membrane subunit [Hymenobacter cellulosivorans]|uniref:Efflux transporter outer membrane subunit n=1 Tax=Hymenobacter cellulosivorans TaxID=2932249 RepID=A0ABY4FET7_9BACT|nr:efflux transporter outer membrane subunit [Hymenobacter cellulosivorans]UOQ55033.1 efflux transporter outer membrane subunit [Hymenobacter cellulosivorans]
MRLPFAFLFGATLLLSSGCRVAAPTEPTSAPAVPTAFVQSAADTLHAGHQPWRQFFQDPALTALIDTALRQNLDLRLALQRVESARAQYLARRGALLPTVSAAASASGDRYGRYTLNGVGNFDTNLSPNIDGQQRIPGPVTPEFFGGLRSSWEIDLWGKLKQRRQAAYLRVLASEQGRHLVTTNVVAEVARLYYELLTADNQLAVLERNIGLQREALKLMRVQKQAGRATELAVQQFAAQVARTESLAHEARQRVTEAETSLNRLLGRYPRRITRGQPLPGQVLPERLGAGVPATALLRRPDVRQAELELQAARADVAAARAAFLPSLTLTPYVGFNSYRAATLLDPASLAYGALAGLTGPLLNRAQFKADFRLATAGSYEAYYRYQQSLQAGFREVVNGLQGLENHRAASAARQQEVELLTKAVATSNELFVAGYASYLEVITAQRSVLEAELSLAESRHSQLQQSVSLYRALGGGWQ